MSSSTSLCCTSVEEERKDARGDEMNGYIISVGIISGNVLKAGNQLKDPDKCLNEMQEKQALCLSNNRDKVPTENLNNKLTFRNNSRK